MKNKRNVKKTNDKKRLRRKLKKNNKSKTNRKASRKIGIENLKPIKKMDLMANNKMQIEGEPTKIFFISMITKDISLRDAIIDLIDNSIDGAKKNIALQSYSNLYIHVTIDSENNQFIIEDNCGGFSLETAKKYAFRFGRPPDAPTEKGSIGRFGVGMKRALFKMGNSFEVESKHQADHFEVNVDTNKWQENTTDWSFNYTIIDSGSSDSNLDNDGTYIKVTDLKKDILSDFEDPAWRKELKYDIQKNLSFYLSEGIEIKLNGEILKKKNLTLINNPDIKPYYQEKTIGEVTIKIIAGLTDTGEPSEAGWYIYCNKRLVHEHDQDELTGWGAGGLNKFHHKFAMFRGLVFFDSEDTFNLPLTTTKKGIDSSASIFKIAKQMMRDALIQIQNYLKDVDKLDDPDDFRKDLAEEHPRTDVTELYSKDYSTIATASFKAPKVTIEDPSGKETKINYKVPKEQFELVKLELEAKTAKEVGEKTFNYYINMEGL